MKLILYIIALVAIAGAAFTSYQNIAKHEEQIVQTNKLIKKQKMTDEMIDAAQQELKGAEATRTAAETTQNNLKADIGVLKSDNVNLEKQDSSIGRELTSLQTEKDEVDNVIATLEQQFENDNVPLAQAPEFFNKLIEEKKQLTNESNNLAVEVEAVGKDVAKNKETLADFDARRKERLAKLKANSVSSPITHVDNSWGFVVIKPSANSALDQNSKLIVLRGDDHVGRLKVTAVESGRILADIDYDSLVGGRRIRPGDRVILAKPNTY